MTIRESINAYRNELLNAGQIDGNRLGEILVELSALSGNISDHIIECESAYGKVYNEILELPYMSAAKAKIKIMSTPESLNYRRAKALEESVTQMIGSIKYLIRVKENEYSNSRTQ